MLVDPKSRDVYRGDARRQSWQKEKSKEEWKTAYKLDDPPSRTDRSIDRVDISGTSDVCKASSQLMFRHLAI